MFTEKPANSKIEIADMIQVKISITHNKEKVAREPFVFLCVLNIFYSLSCVFPGKTILTCKWKNILKQLLLATQFYCYRPGLNGLTHFGFVEVLCVDIAIRYSRNIKKNVSRILFNETSFKERRVFPEIQSFCIEWTLTSIENIFCWNSTDFYVLFLMIKLFMTLTIVLLLQ